MLFDRTRRKSGLFLFVLPALLAGTSVLAPRPAQALTRQDEMKDETTYTLKRVYAKGDKNRYKLSINIKSDNPALNGGMGIVMLMLEQVKSVKDDGAVQVNTEFEEATLKLGDNETDMSSMMPKVIQTFDAKGNIVKVETEGGSGPFASGGDNQLQMFSNTQTNYLPEKPVKVGDSWDFETSIASSDGKAPKTKAKGKATLLGKETVKGIETLKIKTEVSSELPKETAGGGRMSILMTNYVDAKTGRPVRSEGNITGAGGPLGSAKIEMTMELLTDADKKTEKKETKKSE